MFLAGRNVIFASNSEPLCNLRLNDGLAGETVHDIMTDHSGRVWIATTNGISVYNGKQLSSFRLHDKEHVAVTVYDLCQTRDHTIYAATEIGLYRLRPGDGDFSRILPEIKEPETLMADGDTLYIGGRQGLQFYDGRRLTTRMVGASPNGLDNIVRHYVKAEDGRILYLTRFNFNRLDPRTGKTTTMTFDGLLPERVVPSQFEIVDYMLFLGTKDSGFYVCDLRHRTSRRIHEIGNTVTSVSKGEDGKICIATDGSGAFLLNASTGEIEERFNMDQQGDHHLPTNAVYCYRRDRHGNNWFGLVRYGVVRSYYSGTLFKPFSFGGFDTATLNVRSYFMRGHECLIGTQNGLYYINDSTATVKYFPPSTLSGGHIVTCINHFDGEYYIGTYDGGLSILNPQTLAMRSQTLSEKLNKASIGDMKTDGDGRLWIGSSWGLFIYDKQRGTRNYTEQNSGLKGGLILNIIFDRKGNAWLTGHDGISIFSRQSSEIVDVKFPDGFFNTQPWLRGTLGHNGTIYMRNGMQTFYTDSEMRHFGELRLPFNFDDKWSRSFIDDMNGHYWVASAKGLFRFSYKLDQTLRFGHGDGLRGDFINDMSLDGDRRLWIATSDGLYTMPTDSLDPWANRRQFKVAIYNIWLGDKLLTLGDELTANDTHSISLPWNFGSARLFINPVLLDYARHTGRLYEYRVDDGKWTTLHNDERIIIDDLLPGTHSLDIRLLGFAGTTSTYHISVVPTAWAMVEAAAFMLLVVLFLLWNKYRKRNRSLLNERNDMEDALIEVEQQLQNIESSADDAEAAAEEAGEAQPAKYQRVKIDETECADIVARIRAYMEHEKAYANADLKLKTIADELHLSPSKLSQVFNLYLNENYYDFVNRYRLDEFKRLIEAGEHKRITITALSEQCGFRRSNFYATFRKVEGMSPAEYLKKQGIKT